MGLDEGDDKFGGLSGGLYGEPDSDPDVDDAGDTGDVAHDGTGEEACRSSGLEASEAWMRLRFSVSSSLLPISGDSCRMRLIGRSSMHLSSMSRIVGKMIALLDGSCCL